MELELQTPQQHAIADLLWAAQDEDDVQEIVRTYGHVAVVVRELMIAAFIDEVSSTKDAANVINSILLRSKK